MSQELLNTQAAADWLDKAIPGESRSYWSGVLINNRRNDRSQVYKLPLTRIGKGAFYSVEALNSYAEFEKSRRLGSIKLSGRAAEALHAFGVGQGGSTTGRIWKGASVTLQTDGAGEVFVQLVIEEPLAVFRMAHQQALELGEELLATGKAAQRHAA